MWTKFSWPTTVIDQAAYNQLSWLTFLTMCLKKCTILIGTLSTKRIKHWGKSMRTSMVGPVRRNFLMLWRCWCLKTPCRTQTTTITPILIPRPQLPTSTTKTSPIAPTTKEHMLLLPSNGSSIKSSPNNISYQQSGPSSYLDANYAETSRVLQPNTLATNIQSTVPPVTVISSTSVQIPATWRSPLPPRKYKITTETYSSSATYKYWFVNYLLSFTCSFLYLVVSYYRFNQEAGNCTNFQPSISLPIKLLCLFLVFWGLMSYVVEVG